MEEDFIENEKKVNHFYFHHHFNHYAKRGKILKHRFNSMLLFVRALIPYRVISTKMKQRPNGILVEVEIRISNDLGERAAFSQIRKIFPFIVG